jgi:1-acyl-sn-glycerol-3-phosphate acyltransferase
MAWSLACLSAFLRYLLLQLASIEWAALWHSYIELFALGMVLLPLLISPARVLGMVPYAWTMLAGCTLWLTVNKYCPLVAAVAFGSIGCLIGSLGLAGRNCLMEANAIRPSRGWGLAWFTVVAVVAVASPLLFFRWFESAELLIHVLLVAGCLSTVIFGIWLCRPALELLLALIAVVLYRFRSVGPGVGKIPRNGPLLVIANHAAWLDPFWLGKVIPRPITPMMSSKFYDLPIIRFLMRKMVRAIRVVDSNYRHNAPELDEAVRRLDEGECVVIFPEGWLRRREEHVIRNFGQGVWRILRERPSTPVVSFWIEGGWGSWWSHRHGPIGRGKWFDILRKITLSIGEPEVLSAELLADHRKTRHYLRDKVFGLRALVPDAEMAGGEGQGDAVRGSLAR